MAQVLHDATWRALFVRDFARALTVAERAHALFPVDLAIETNRAHSCSWNAEKKLRRSNRSALS